MTHAELCNRAVRWLRGSRYCNPVFQGIASCSEVPDAIGWSSRWSHRGSTVVECKTSRSDFYADKKKRVTYHRPSGITPDLAHGYGYKGLNKKEIEEGGFVALPLPMMGNYRFYFCEPGIITAELLAEHAPDHGLLHLIKSRVQVIVKAPKRETPNLAAEVRYLRFAIINDKNWRNREASN